MMRTRHRVAPLLIGLVLISGCQAMATTRLALGNRMITKEHNTGTPIDLLPRDATTTQLGALDYRGGLALSHESEHFGGLSGLLVSPDGTRFLAVSDKGYWVAGTLHGGDEKLTGVGDISVAPMLGLDGAKIEGKSLGDAESLIGDMDGQVLVSFERDHRVWSYDLGTHGFKARPQKIALPPEVSSLHGNSGLEGIARLEDEAGTLLIMSEGTPDEAGNFKGWLVTDTGAAQVSLKPDKPFNLTDLAVLPGGDVLTLERRFSPASGPGYQIRRIDAVNLKPGVLLDGPVLAMAMLPYTVDNMEGLDIRVTDEGQVLLYLVSDDNFNPLQRTLLLMFELTKRDIAE